jgi:pSer/pThr/pTyr-binding forkhead associated (FHA) protein
VIIGRGPGHAPQATRSVDDGVRTLALRLPDRWMSPAHARLGRVIGSWFLSDAASKNGTWLNGAPVERASITYGDLIELGQTFFRTSVPVDQDVLDWEAIGAPAPLLVTLIPAL